MIANPPFNIKIAYATSKLFKASLFITLASLLLGILFTFIGVFSSCISYTSNSCSDYFVHSAQACKQFDVQYCCGYDYYEGGESCGNYNNCYVKPFYYNVCMGELITAWTLFFVGFLSAVMAIVVFCYLKGKSNQIQAPYYQNLIYPNYPVYNQQQPQNNWRPAAVYVNYPHQVFQTDQKTIKDQKKQACLNQTFTQAIK